MRLFIKKGIYHLEFSAQETPSGKKQTCSLKTTDLKKAEKMLDYFQRKILREGRLSFSLGRFRDKIYEWLLENKPIHTTKNYMRALDLFIKLYEEHTSLNMLKYTKSNDFICYLLLTYAPETVNTHLGNLRAIFNHGMNLNICNNNPFVRFPRINIDIYEIAERDWLKIKVRHNNSCLACGKKEPEIKLTRDHIYPKSLGGKLSRNNTQPLCGSCNSSKGAHWNDYRPQPNTRTNRGPWQISAEDLAMVEAALRF